jgi:hypothetical protein
MKSYADQTQEELEKSLRSLNDKLALAAPELVEEIALVRSFLKRATEGKEMVYANVSGVKEAIDECLRINGDFKLSQYDFVSEIINGGYRADPKAARGSVNMSVNYYKRTGYLTEQAGCIGRVSKLVPVKAKK